MERNPPERGPIVAIAPAIDRRRLLLDGGGPALEISVADCAIEVNGGFGDSLETIEIQRALINDIGGLNADTRIPWDKIAIRGHCRVNGARAFPLRGRSTRRLP